MRSRHVPMEVLRLQVEGEHIGQQQIERSRHVARCIGSQAGRDLVQGGTTVSRGLCLHESVPSDERSGFGSPSRRQPAPARLCRFAMFIRRLLKGWQSATRSLYIASCAGQSEWMGIPVNSPLSARDAASRKNPGSLATTKIHTA